MYAITTKYLGPTNTQGARIKATSEIGSITLGYDHHLTSSANHEAAAYALLRNSGQGTSLIGGHTSTGWAFVQVPS